jgi:hypothetical protein
MVVPGFVTSPVVSFWYFCAMLSLHLFESPLDSGDILVRDLAREPVSDSLVDRLDPDGVGRAGEGAQQRRVDDGQPDDLEGQRRRVDRLYGSIGVDLDVFRLISELMMISPCFLMPLATSTDGISDGSWTIT